MMFSVYGVMGVKAEGLSLPPFLKGDKIDCWYSGSLEIPANQPYYYAQGVGCTWEPDTVLPSERAIFMDKTLTYIELYVDGTKIDLNVWYTYAREPFVGRAKMYYTQFESNTFTGVHTFKTNWLWNGTIFKHTVVEVTFT